MTNYSERFDEVLFELANYAHGIGAASGYGVFVGGEPQEKAKQAITSLIKELVAEAKPQITFRKPEGMPNTLAVDFAHRHLDEFEQNILKALEELK